jgi:hypothetical protein
MRYVRRNANRFFAKIYYYLADESTDFRALSALQRSEGFRTGGTLAREAPVQYAGDGRLVGSCLGGSMDRVQDASLALHGVRVAQTHFFRSKQATFAPGGSLSRTDEFDARAIHAPYLAGGSKSYLERAAAVSAFDVGV